MTIPNSWDKKTHFNMIIQSNGMGTQSLAMYLMSSTGLLPRFDYSIFVDLGKEKTKTYEILSWLLKWQKKNNGIPIEVVREKNLYQDLLNKENSTGQRFSSIPAFTAGDGMLKRQCTTEYKIEQIKWRTKQLLGLGKNSRFPKIIDYIGFSIDELTRVSRPPIKEKWHIKVFPFCNAWASYLKIGHRQDKFFPDHGVTRLWLKRWIIKNGYPDPGKQEELFNCTSGVCHI